MSNAACPWRQLHCGRRPALLCALTISRPPLRPLTLHPTTLPLRQELGLPVDPSAPLLGFIGRLDWQKGVDLIADNYEWLMAGALLCLLWSCCACCGRAVVMLFCACLLEHGQHSCARCRLPPTTRLRSARGCPPPAEGAQLVLLGSGAEELEAALWCAGCGA